MLGKPADRPRQACLLHCPAAVSLRMTVSGDGAESKAPEKAFGGYALAMCVMFLAALNYIG